jgi:hypothetical protein
MVKPGYKTTEFWLSVAAMLVGAILASGIVPNTGIWMQLAGIATTLLNGLGYSVSRGIAKNNATPNA